MEQAKSAREAVVLLIHAYERLDIESVLYYLTDDIIWIGTGFHEHRFGKEAVRSLLKDDFMNDPNPYIVEILEFKENVICSGTSAVFALMNFSKGNDISMSVKSRSTYVCAETEDGYKVCSWHCSVGTTLLNEDEYFPISFANDILQKATYDALTRLMNRASFEGFVEKYLKAEPPIFAYILIDLDNFKYVNDHYGHQCGDEVLKFVAEQLTISFEEMDVIARLGGDEFVVFITNLKNKKMVEDKVYMFIQNLSQTVYLNLQPYIPSASVGVFISEEGKNVSYEDCYRLADTAMYQAKNSGKSTWKIVE